MPPDTLAGRLARRDATGFVGRTRELEFFESLFVDDPPASVVLVHGPGGIGKSTLLREVARRASGKGWSPRLVEGRELAPVPGEIERALNGIGDVPKPLVMFDTYERMSAAGGWLRSRLLPGLPDQAVVVMAGREKPDPEWFQGGWENLTVAMELAPLDQHEAMTLCATHGLTDRDMAGQLVTWAEGSPLALALAADALKDDPSWEPGRIEDHPNLARAIIRRLAQTELDGGNLDVAAVAAIARVCDARMLRDVLPDVDPDEAEAWLRGRSFAEPVGAGVALHEIVRRALRADLRARTPERERELRRRIADHLHARGLKGEPRLIVDLAELIDDPAVRWGLGAEGSVRFRPDNLREDDIEEAERHMSARGPRWWASLKHLVEVAPDRAVTVRDAHDRLCGLAFAVTPANAPAAADADAVLGPWLEHARREHPGVEVMMWRDSIDFVGHGDVRSPVLSILNTAALLRSGNVNTRYTYLPIDPGNPAAVGFAAAVGAQPLPELEVSFGSKSIRCHVIDHGEGGILNSTRSQVYAEVGLAAPGPAEEPEPDEQPITVGDVRDALRNLEHPLELASSPLARGATPEERAASVRVRIEEAVARAFGETADEQLLRGVLERGYLDPSASHESAADELHVSRATYFRRLRAASQRVADWLIAESR